MSDEDRCKCGWIVPESVGVLVGFEDKAMPRPTGIIITVKCPACGEQHQRTMGPPEHTHRVHEEKETMQ